MQVKNDDIKLCSVVRAGPDDLGVEMCFGLIGKNGVKFCTKRASTCTTLAHKSRSWCYRNMFY